MIIKFHPEARLDLREGKAYYRHHSPMAAIAFAHHIDAAINRMSEAPHSFPEGDHGTRYLVLPRRFPYTVVYLASPERVVIVAFAHQSREPGYWHHRV